MTLRFLITCGLAFLGVLGCTGSEQGKNSEVRAVTEGTSYSSPERQRQLKAALAGANIAYQTEMRDGQEFVVWDASEAAAVKAALESPLGPELPPGRHMGASKELKEEFENWLKENNVSYFTKTQDAREYVVWTEHDNSKVREWLRARLPETVYAATVGQPASSASGAR
jgi:hypothetical protein